MSRDAALSEIAHTAARLCHAHDVVILLHDGTGLWAVAHATQSRTTTAGAGLRDLETSDATQLSFRERRTVHGRDARVDRATRNGAGRTRTMLIAPLVRNGDAVGALVARREIVKRFTPPQVAMLEALASHAALAVAHDATGAHGDDAQE